MESHLEEILESLLQFFILLPIAGVVISLLIPSKKESLISWHAFFIVGLHMVAFWAFAAIWLFNGHHMLDLKEMTLFKAGEYEFFIQLFFDKISAVYMFVGSLLTFLVTVYSRYYLHREDGYKRFFNTILFFYTGYNIIIFSGNLETLTIGWEILGLSSFLLIAFYRNRYLPVKNAVKVFSIYRIGDVGLLLAMWMSHHLWHENVTYSKLHNYELVHEHISDHSLIGVFISLMLLVTAAAKSAQVPFTSWLPRAMEGPTPSSAIFYGSLSVHLGAFILLRTFPFWENQPSVRVLIGVIGLLTALMATGIARVQSSIKSQLAYSSAAQIGIIFIEISLGLDLLALIHFAGNAFLRTYQLLVSPSVVSYLIREQFYDFKPHVHNEKHLIPKKIMNSLYIMCIKEWNLGRFMYNIYWSPLKWAGNKINFLTVKNSLFLFLPSYLLGLFCLYMQDSIPGIVRHYLPAFFSAIGLVLVLKSFTERRNVMMSWILIIMNHFWIALAISFNEPLKTEQVFLYMGGVIGSAIIGYAGLTRLRIKEGSVDMNQFCGHAYEHPRLAFVFLLSCLGLSGFPISPTFIGEDFIFSQIHSRQVILASCMAISFITNGLSLIRIYARVFLGPHLKTYHEIAYRSS